jgi:O-antigen/teichoic acid export membrane protein
MLRGGQAFMASAAVTLLGSGLGSAFTVVNEAIAARILGPDGYGLYAVGMMLAKVSEVLAVFGLPLAVLRYVPLHLSRSEARLALATILGAVVVPLLLGLCFAACLWLCANAIARELFNAPGAAPFIAVLGLAVPGLALAELLGNVARAFGRPVVYVLVRNLIPPVGYSLMLFALLWTGRGGADVPCAYLTATGTGALLGVVVVGGIVHRRIGKVLPQFRLRPVYAYAVPIGLNSIVAITIAWTDLMVLGLFADPVQVGMYRACMQAAIGFDLVWNACSAATAPLYPILIAEQAWTRLQEVYGTAIRTTVLLVLPMLAVIASNAPDILGLLHPDFRVAAFALAILAGGHAVKASCGAASVLLVLGGRQVQEVCNGMLAAALNLLLNLILVPRFGLMGAASATAATLAALSVLRCWQVRRAFRLASFDVSILRACAATALVTILVAFLAATIGMGTGSGILALAVRVVGVGCVLALVLWFLCLRRDDRAELLGLLTRRAEVAPDG